MKARARVYQQARAAMRLGVVIETRMLKGGRGFELFLNGTPIGYVNRGQYAKLHKLSRAVPDATALLLGSRLRYDNAEKIKMFVVKNRNTPHAEYKTS